MYYFWPSCPALFSEIRVNKAYPLLSSGDTGYLLISFLDMFLVVFFLIFFIIYFFFLWSFWRDSPIHPETSLLSRYDFFQEKNQLALAACIVLVFFTEEDTHAKFLASSFCFYFCCRKKTNKPKATILSIGFPCQIPIHSRCSPAQGASVWRTDFLTCPLKLPPLGQQQAML